MNSNSISSPAPSPGWMRPEEVMKMRKLKAKRQALNARMSTTAPLQIFAPKKGSTDKSSSCGIKRKNPFRYILFIYFYFIDILKFFLLKIRLGFFIYFFN